MGNSSRLRRAGPTVLCVAFALLPQLLGTESPGARVIVLANSDDPDSLRIARHYATAREVPAPNVIALKLPHAESISWREFIVTLWQPLLDELVRQQWIHAVPMTATDPVGRQKFATSGHRIDALVVCRGVPLKIEHDPALYAAVLPFTSRGEFRTNAGAVDAELSMLALPNYPINAFVPNPLFQNDRVTAFDLGQVVRVSRLDGPSADDAIGLVDRAIAAERTGLLGRAYVDLSNHDPTGNAWLQAVARQLVELGFDTDVDREPATLPRTARFDAPALYFGWYAGDVDGPFTLPGFRFPPGAIALHIHSFSAGSLRSPSNGWAGPLVARGVTATVGNVHEPYLQFTHRPDLLLRALARGSTLAEAAYYALPALSWQAVLVGDPLFRPFAVSLAQQLDKLEELAGGLAGYALLRRMHKLDTAGDTDAATDVLRKAQRLVPNLAVGVTLARRLRAQGDPEGAASALGFVSLLRSYPAEQWALAREAARLLHALGRPARALDVWRALLGAELPRDLRVSWLPEARESAAAAGDSRQATAWKREVDELTAAAAQK